MKILTGNRPLLSIAPGCLKISQKLFFALSRLYQELFFEARNYWAIPCKRDFPLLKNPGTPCPLWFFHFFMAGLSDFSAPLL